MRGGSLCPMSRNVDGHSHGWQYSWGNFTVMTCAYCGASVNAGGGVYSVASGQIRPDTVPNVHEQAAELARLRAVADAAEAIYDQHHTDEGLRPEDPEWPELGAALKALEGLSDA